MKKDNFYYKKLDNGISVIFEERKIPVVAISASVRYGAQYENENIKGISHFIEHMVFKGTKNRSFEQIPREIEKRGGIINAFTEEDITSYWNKIPSRYFNIGSDVVRDLVLNPLFDENSFEIEKKVILEEIKMYKDNPMTYVLEKIKECLYEKPFNISIAGTLESVSNMSRQQLIDLFNSVYSTNNMIFCSVGKVSWEEVLEEAKKFPKSNKKINKVAIVLKNSEHVEKRKDIDQAHEVIGFHMPKLIEKNRYAAEIFDSILGGGMSSRLFQEIREKRGLCYAIKSSLEQSRDYSYEIIYCGTTKDKVKEVKELVLNEIKKIRYLKQTDLSEAKETLIGLREISSEKCDSTMIELLREEIGGDAGNYYSYEENVSKVSLEDVRNLADLKGFSFVALVPED